MTSSEEMNNLKEESRVVRMHYSVNTSLLGMIIN
jgi:hypothetical protein